MTITTPAPPKKTTRLTDNETRGVIRHLEAGKPLLLPFCYQSAHRPLFSYSYELLFPQPL